jgi:ABC-2 type transport system ATP-binding protein
MMTVVRPTHAEGTILGRPIGHKGTLGRIGYLPENHRFPKYLTGRQVIEFFAALAKVDRPTRRRQAERLLELVGMTAWGGTKISQYSKGMLQRIGLAQAMAADPDLIVLDEPTDGVDPAGRRDIRDALIRLRHEGKTIFINSHLLSELESVCDRVAILVHGAVARQGTIDELTIAKQCYLFDLAGMETGRLDVLPNAVNAALGGILVAAAPIAQTAPPILQYSSAPPPIPAIPPPISLPLRGKFPDQTWCELDGSVLRIGHTDPVLAQRILDSLRAQGIIIRRMQLVRPTLEELFFEAVGNAPSTAGARVA